MKTTTCGAAVLLAAPLLTTLVPAATLRVPSGHVTIQAAIDAAQPGDTVQVAPGIYRENLVISKNIRLVGSGLSVTLLDGRGRGSCISYTRTGSIHVEGLTIYHSAGVRPANGIRVSRSSNVQVMVRDCRIENTVHALSVEDGLSGKVTVRDNVIVDNIEGMEVEKVDLLVSGNTISDHGSYGVQHRGPGALQLYNNIITNAGLWGVSTTASAIFAAGNDAWGNSRGNYLVGSTLFVPTSGLNISQDPRFVDPAAGDYHLQATSPCIGAGWSFARRIDIGALQFNPNRVRPLARSFGQACGTTTLGAPRLPVVGLPALDLVVTGAPSSAPGSLLLGTSNTSLFGIPLPLELTLLGAPRCFLNVAPTVLVPVQASPAGSATVTFAIPNTASLLGQTLFAQWAVFGTSGFGFSNGLRLTIGE